MKLVLLSMIMAIFTILNGSDIVGTIQKVDGIVKVKSEGSFKKKKTKVGMELHNGDLLTTSKKAIAVLKLVDESILALDPSSSIHFKTPKDAQQTEGKVFYKITSRDAKNALKVKTPFAIIGIKGTTFVVDTSQNASVRLKEGLIGIRSIKEEFNLYRKQQEEAFNNFVKEEENAFEKFKQEAQKGTLEITKEFDLEAENTVSFSGNTVNERAWTKEDDKEFEYFENMIKGI